MILRYCRQFWSDILLGSAPRIFWICLTFFDAIYKLKITSAKILDNYNLTTSPAAIPFFHSLGFLTSIITLFYSFTDFTKSTNYGVYTSKSLGRDFTSSQKYPQTPVYPILSILLMFYFANFSSQKIINFPSGGNKVPTQVAKNPSKPIAIEFLIMPAFRLSLPLVSIIIAFYFCTSSLTS
jgi:hypothetical protein